MLFPVENVKMKMGIFQQADHACMSSLPLVCVDSYRNTALLTPYWILHCNTCRIRVSQDQPITAVLGGELKFSHTPLEAEKSVLLL